MIECLYLSSNELKKIQTVEGNIVKRMMNIDKRSKTTSLLYALDIEPIQIRYQKMRCDFLNRIAENPITRHISIHTCLTGNTKDKSIISQIHKWTDSNQEMNRNLNHYLENCKRHSKELDHQIKTAKGNGIAESIKYLIENENQATRHELVSLLTKAFNNKKQHDTNKPIQKTVNANKTPD